MRPKKSSFVSGDQPIENSLSPTCPHKSNVYENIYLLKKTHTHTNSKFIRTNLSFFPFKQLKIGLFVFQ